MKPFIFLFIVFSLSANLCLSQGSKSAFLELGGNGLGFSANFDARFKKEDKGLGFRAGIGFFPGVRAGDNSVTIFSWPTILSVPVGINYLAGKAPNYFEAGLGTTYLYAKGHFTFFFFGTDGTLRQLVFIPSAGYRYAKPGRSFQFRISITPYIFSGGTAFYGGISVGYKF
jgi:hypothetical protein